MSSTIRGLIFSLIIAVAVLGSDIELNATSSVLPPASPRISIEVDSLNTPSNFHEESILGSPYSEGAGSRVDISARNAPSQVRRWSLPNMSSQYFQHPSVGEHVDEKDTTQYWDWIADCSSTLITYQYHWHHKSFEFLYGITILEDTPHQFLNIRVDSKEVDHEYMLVVLETVRDILTAHDDGLGTVLLNIDEVQPLNEDDVWNIFVGFEENLLMLDNDADFPDEWDLIINLVGGEWNHELAANDFYQDLIKFQDLLGPVQHLDVHLF
jgi:hypothetical protein